MSSVFMTSGNNDAMSTGVVIRDLGPVFAPLPNLLNPPKTSTPPPSVLNPSPPSSNQYAIYGLHNESPTPIANVPAKPLTSATLLTAAINTPASKRAIPNVVQQGVPNFHSAYLANNSFQMTSNGVVKKSTFIDAPMTTNALPQATVAPTIAPTISATLPPSEEEDTPDYTNYFYIAGGILIVLFIFSKK